MMIRFRILLEVVVVKDLPDAGHIFRVHVGGRRVAGESEFLPGCTVDIVVWHTVARSIDCRHGLKEVHRDDIVGECHVPHGHDNICGCDVTRAPVGAAVTGCAEPEIGIGQCLIFESEHCPPHELTDAVRAPGC